MKEASGSERRGQEGRRETESLFPAEGHFRPVVPLSQGGVEAAHLGEPPASAEPEEPEETTLVTARLSPGPRAAHTSRAKQGGGQSWASLAVAVLLSLAAGAATGVYIFRWQRAAETYRTGPPAGDAAPGAVAAEVSEPEPAAAPLAPRPSGPDVPPVIPEARSEAGTKAERVNRPAQVPKTLPQAAEPPARRANQTEPRGIHPAREAAQASPAPRPMRAKVVAPRAERNTPATVTRSERPALISSPPPSTKPKKVIQWP